jgi:hypothetical protein
MTPGKYNMICPQGTTFTKRLTWTIDDIPVDLTGYTATMQAKISYISKREPIFIITTENEGISVDDEGNIDIILTSNQTGSFAAREYVYDLELEKNNEVYRILQGKFIVTPRVGE